MKRNPATYPEALQYLDEVWDPVAGWSELKPIYDALHRGEIPAEVEDPSSLFRRMWDLVADYEAESGSRNYQYYAMSRWFDGDADLEEEYG
jgi:hypothetical protein